LTTIKCKIHFSGIIYTDITLIDIFFSFVELT